MRLDLRRRRYTLTDSVDALTVPREPSTRICSVWQKPKLVRKKKRTDVSIAMRRQRDAG